ncbi:MAG: hypothetical protein QM730_03365 [Anaerolineales bacterium]
MLVFTSFLSIPVQAKSGVGEIQQSNDPAGKPPTKTKRPKSPPKTATPKPANTMVAKPTNTAALPMATTVAPVSTGTLMETGTAVPETGTAVVLPTYTFSSEMNTVVAQLTATSGVVYMTSTSMALTASTTPTNAGAPTSTPNALEQTATSIALTTVPMGAFGYPTVTLLADATAIEGAQIPVTSGEPANVRVPRKLFWILEVGLLILLLLFYLLNRELKRSSIKSK